MEGHSFGQKYFQKNFQELKRLKNKESKIKHVIIYFLGLETGQG
jgi:hypothetical protein